VLLSIEKFNENRYLKDAPLWLGDCMDRNRDFGVRII